MSKSVTWLPRATDRPAADDAQSRRQLGQGKDVLVGEIAALVAARYGWGKGPGTGGDDRPAEAEPLTVDLDGIRGDKATLTDKDVDSQIAKTLGAVVTTDSGSQPPHPFHDGAKIPLARHLGPAKVLGGASGFVPGTGRADDAFRRHTAVIETVTAHQTPLHQGDFGPETDGSGGRDQTGGPSADDNQVIPLGRLGIDPIGRVNLLEQGLVVAVERLHQRLELRVESPGRFWINHLRPPGKEHGERCG
jgi:hypothetical protein